MSLSFDGSVASAGSNGNATSLSVSLTTSLTDDIIVLVVGLFSNNTSALSNNYPCVSTVSGGGLNWARRSRVYQVTNVSSFPIIVEVWWAHAPSALSAASITANFSTIGTTAYTSLTAFGVNGADLNEPFDPNTSLPAVASFGSGGSSSHPVSGISTTNPNSLEFAVLATSTGGSGTAAVDSGFTLIANSWANATWGGYQYEYKINSSALSSVTQNVFASLSSISTNYIAYVDAIQAAPATVRAGPKFVNTTGGVLANASSVTPSLPASRTNGNLLLAFASITDTSVNAPSWPSGWNVIETWHTGSQNGSKAWRYVDGTETAPTITWTGTHGAMGLVVQYTGVHPTSPIGASSHNSSNVTAVTCPNITTTAANSLVVSYLDDGKACPPPLPTNYTARSSGSAASPATGGWQVSDEFKAASGSTSDPVSVTSYMAGDWLAFVTEIVPPSYISASAAQTIDAFTNAAASAVTVVGSASQIVPAFAQSFTGTTPLGVSANAAQTVDAFINAAALEFVVTSDTPQGLEDFAQVAAATITVDAVASQTVPTFTQVFTGYPVNPLSIVAAQTVPAFVNDSTGTILVQGASAKAVPAFAQVATAHPIQPVSGSASQTFDAFVQSFTAHRGDQTPGLLFKGTIGNVSINRRGLATFEARSSLTLGRGFISERFGPTCRADLFDARCKVNKDSFKANATVAAVSGQFSFTVTASPDGRAVSGWYDMGQGVIEIGVNAGTAFAIKTWTAGSLTIEGMEPVDMLVSAGDTLTLYPGCDKSSAMCINRYANIINYRGEEFAANRDLQLTTQAP